jgi:hypothetical protein
MAISDSVLPAPVQTTQLEPGAGLMAGRPRYTPARGRFYAIKSYEALPSMRQLPLGL